MNLKYGHNYEQEDPGWYIWDENTGLVVMSSLDDIIPTPEQMRHINQHQYLKDVYDLIVKYKEESKAEETEEDLELESCEQCGEPAWDGYICHSCGMKHI